MNIGSQKPYNYYNYNINHNANSINNHSKTSTNSAKKLTLLEDNHHPKNEKIAPAITKISYIPKPIQSNFMVNYKSNYSSNYNSYNNQIPNDKNNNYNYKNPNNQQKYVNKMSPYTEIIYNKENEHKDPNHSSTTSIKN